jgi:PhoH-like ATPase
MKTFIIDTNVLLSDTRSLYAFEENEIILPFTALEELDKIKSRPNEVGANARECVRQLSELIAQNPTGALRTGVPIRSGGTLRLAAVSDFIFDSELGVDWDAANKDNHILNVCRGVAKQHKEEGKDPPILVTRDILLRVKCDFLGIPCEDYKNAKVVSDADGIYTGIKHVDASEENIQDYWECEKNPSKELCLTLDEDVVESLIPNQFIILHDPNSTSQPVVRYVDKNKSIEIIHTTRNPVYGLIPRNREQHLALDLLLDTDIKLVTLLGTAGGGKTLLSLAAGLEQVIEKKIYKSLLICRPIVPVGNDIGFLPGDKKEKLDPWMAPIKDNLKQLLFSGRKSRYNEMTFDQFLEEGVIEMEAITYLRGRSISDAFILIDEAQNLSAHELKTIITRAGENTKIILTGDVGQIDSMFLDAVSNGLTIAIEKFKPYAIAGHITLVKGERSELSAIAVEAL